MQSLRERLRRLWITQLELQQPLIQLGRHSVRDVVVVSTFVETGFIVAARLFLFHIKSSCKASGLHDVPFGDCSTIPKKKMPGIVSLPAS